MVTLYGVQDQLVHGVVFTSVFFRYEFFVDAFFVVIV